jgi:hypothetical protein
MSALCRKWNSCPAVFGGRMTVISILMGALMASTYSYTYSVMPSVLRSNNTSMNRCISIRAYITVCVD